ncbi:MAG: homoserine O-acetyltransferase [Lysobacteraceae bacterium]|nr:MAG: homoserine O-acetyltransferase [Xanthomonadaceae bacterium]
MSLADCLPPTDQDLPAALAPAECRGMATRLRFRHAGERKVGLRIEVVGPSKAPAVWVAGGISAHRHVVAHARNAAAGWWQDVVGPGRALDPARLRLLSFDWLGADGELDIPIDTADQADAIACALDALGIERLHGFVGASYGGMVALQFAARHPQRVGRIAVLSAADRPHPYASAFRSLQRQIVALGQLQCAETLGLSLARQLAMLSYRTPREFAARFDAAPRIEGGRVRCAAESYLEACGDRYVARWTATAFVRLSESIDLHAVDPATVRVPTALLAVRGDWLAPPEQVEALAARLPAPVGCQVIDSMFGHDAFLKEREPVDRLLRQTLHPL